MVTMRHPLQHCVKSTWKTMWTTLPTSDKHHRCGTSKTRAGEGRGLIFLVCSPHLTPVRAFSSIFSSRLLLNTHTICTQVQPTSESNPSTLATHTLSPSHPFSALSLSFPTLLACVSAPTAHFQTPCHHPTTYIHSIWTVCMNVLHAF